MKKIVFLMGGYYPVYGAGGVCLGNIIEELDSEYEIIVIAIDYKNELPQKCEYKNHKIIRIQSKWHKKECKIQSVEKQRNLLKYLFIFEKTMSFLLSRTIIDKDLINCYLKALNEITDIDVIIPTCAPFESILASVEYKNYNDDVRIMPFLFDQFASSVGLYRNKIFYYLCKSNHIQLEEKMLKYSNRVFFTESWEDHLNTYFSSYNAMFTKIEHPILKPPKDNDKGIIKNNFIYIGSLSYYNRNPLPFLNLIMSNISEFENYSFDFAGRGDVFDKIMLFNEKCKNIACYGVVSKKLANEMINESKYLLSFGNKDITQTPSKIFELIATGKPIIHWCTSSKDPVISILSKYPNHLILFEKDKPNIQLKKLKAFLDMEYIVLKFEKIKNDYETALPEYTAKLLKREIEYGNL
ncbi:hypothetical protein SAMN02910447_03269 [Ruminococcus sp. YE71]|uniref:hypothetical protein n=1 Tax=unclassified Ruminococcus TaxID=2608920 RepID=UPI000888F305|nr:MULTISPECIES: hypothetical protein [unclassified Ruminococcus]SDA30817.1 hypothetical protein SAMN02910446_03339 [Ruminococcus sp. YE78]SFW50528.1 hypothetical protein SAMN02910447_03269 [Ruminococcus sp. YE71]